MVKRVPTADTASTIPNETMSGAVCMTSGSESQATAKSGKRIEYLFTDLKYRTGGEIYGEQ